MQNELTKMRREFINEVGIYSIDDLENHYRRMTQGHWFDTDTMRFFKSRLSSDLFYGKGVILFISSEKCGHEYPRKYTIRKYTPGTGEITDIGGFQAYSYINKAKREAEKIANNSWL